MTQTSNQVSPLRNLECLKFLTEFLFERLCRYWILTGVFGLRHAQLRG